MSTIKYHVTSNQLIVTHPKHGLGVSLTLKEAQRRLATLMAGNERESLKTAICSLIDMRDKGE